MIFGDYSIIVCICTFTFVEIMDRRSRRRLKGERRWRPNISGARCSCLSSCWQNDEAQRRLSTVRRKYLGHHVSRARERWPRRTRFRRGTHVACTRRWHGVALCLRVLRLGASQMGCCGAGLSYAAAREGERNRPRVHRSVLVDVKRFPCFDNVILYICIITFLP